VALGAQVSLVGDPGKRPPLRAEAVLHPATRKVALLGFGTVGRAVADILCREPHLRLTHVFNRNVERKRVSWVPDRVQWTDNYQDVLQSDADLVIELMGGLEPAHQCIRQALQSGKSVVTANKHVMAKYGPELLDLARQHGQQLEYGASVGGAVPILAALRYGLAGDCLVRACGILNGTCNYILSNMEANATTLPAALAEAQRLGYAESNPCDDVNGLDAACKLSIVTRLGLHAELNAFEVPRQSIANILPEDFRYARQIGCTIRQISLAELQSNSLRSAVGPALIPLQSPLAACMDNQNAIILTGERSGDTVLAGRGAGGHPTAVAVVSDILAIAAKGHSMPAVSSVRKYPSADLYCAHYFRICHRGVDFSRTLMNLIEAHGVRMRKWLQHPDSTNQLAACALEACSAGVANLVATAMEKLDGISQKPLCWPILG
jgi:homoserine dehydrogenase